MPPSEYHPALYPRVTDQWVWGAGDGPDANGWEKQAGSCVANAICNMKEIHEYRQSGTANRYSIGWVFGNRLSSDFQGDDGMVVAQALARLQADGVPPYTALPENEYNGWGQWDYPDTYLYYDWSDVGVPIFGAKSLVSRNYSAVIDKSRKAKIAGYSTSSTIDTIKQSVIDNGAVLVETYIANNFDTLGGDGCTGIVQPVDYNITIGGVKTQHCLCIIGWKLIGGVAYWIVNNNWGNWWWGDANRRGVCYMPVDYSNIIAYHLVVDDTTNTRPSSFYWTHTPVADGGVAITAVEWNSFTSNINEVRYFKGLSDYTFATVTPGMEISAVLWNQAVNAIAPAKALMPTPDMSVPLTKGASTGEASVASNLWAQWFNVIVNDLNYIT